MTSHSIYGRNVEANANANNDSGHNKSSLISRGKPINRKMSRKSSMKSGGGSGQGSPQPRSESKDSLSDSLSGAPAKFTVKTTTLKKNAPVHKRNTSKGAPTAAVKQKVTKKATRSSSMVIEDVGKDWRAYFLGEELEEIYEQIEEGEDPNDFEDRMSMSDDCASEDFLDANDLYQDVYLRSNLME